VRPDHFFKQVTAHGTDGWDLNGEPWGVETVFDHDLVDALRREPLDGRSDIDAALALAQLLHDDLQRYGTGGGEKLSDQEMSVAIRTLRAVLRRLAVPFTIPFRDFTSFRSFWISHGASGSWQARRDLLDSLFGELHTRLTRLEEGMYEHTAVPVSPREETGWPIVDEEIRELQRRFRSSSTAQDYRAVGMHCVGVLEAVGRTVYDPTKHLREGEQMPPPDKTKQRLGRYVECTLAGGDSADLRGLVSKAIEFAHHVKHVQTPTRRDAGIAADSVILIANILRRLEQEI
jgi:hypothetical protein